MVQILIIGGRGFIGRHLAAVLSAAGHQVAAPGRDKIDLAEMSGRAICDELRGADAVINCAGLVSGASMNAVHARGTEKLLKAAKVAGVRRLVHISALGAAVSGDTLYQQSKGAGEDVFRAHPAGMLPEFCVLRPSMIIGRGGASTAMLSALAALPVTPVVNSGQVQPIHIGDFAELVLRVVESDKPLPLFLDAVGPEPMDINNLVRILGRWLQFPLRFSMSVPGSLLAGMGAIGSLFARVPLNRETLIMLRQGNTASPSAVTQALGHPPLPLAVALARTPADSTDRQMARLYFLRPVLRISLALMWIATGILSFGLYPLASSYTLMEQIGLTGTPAGIALFGAAALDTLLGLLLLIRWQPRLIGAAQLATMATFTLLALGLPAEYWLHPFAPLLKNLPIAAATLVMMAIED